MDAEIAFEKAKAYLMTASHDGTSLYEHLFSVITKTMEENPGNVAQNAEKFLSMSSAMRTHQYNHSDVPIHYREEVSPDPRVVDRSKVGLDLYKQPAPEIKTTVTRPKPGVTITTTTVIPKQCPAFRSVLIDSKFWKYCGVGLPQAEVFLLEQSLTRHVMENKLEEVQFLGRINGTRSNYYIAVTKKVVEKGVKVFEETNTMPLPPRKGIEVDMQREPAYKGINRHTFWVCTNAGGAWIALPDITPQQLNAARSIKKFFTGDLSAPVVSYPPFPGDEAVYLRAQVARIWAGTIVSPSGAVNQPEPPEPEPEPDVPEGQQPPPRESKYFPLTAVNKEWAPPEEGVQALNDLTQWVHHTQHIYKMGRATKPPERIPQDGDPEPDPDEAEKKVEEDKELFQPIKGDKLLGIVNIPKIPTEEEENAEEEPKDPEPEPEGEEAQKDEVNFEEDETLLQDDGEEDPLKKKLRAWTILPTNQLYKKHGVVVLRSNRWPGAFAYAANGGKVWGCIYVGNGLKRTDNNYAPKPAPRLQKEAEDIVEVVDATAATEKLVLRGEEPKGADSEEEKDDEADGDEA
eukprot:PhF_6_TR25614/c1_g1_i1/m.35963